jgi:hypothetical protein
MSSSHTEASHFTSFRNFKLYLLVTMRFLHAQEKQWIGLIPVTESPLSKGPVRYRPTWAGWRRASRDQRTLALL